MRSTCTYCILTNLCHSPHQAMIKETISKTLDSYCISKQLISLENFHSQNYISLTAANYCQQIIMAIYRYLYSKGLICEQTKLTLHKHKVQEELTSQCSCQIKQISWKSITTYVTIEKQVLVDFLYYNFPLHSIPKFSNLILWPWNFG